MQKKIKARCSRWRDVFLYAVCGAFVYAYPAQLWREALLVQFVEWLGSPVFADWVQTIIGVVLLVWLLGASGTRFRHFKHTVTLDYPSFLTAVVLACILAPLLPPIPGGSWATETVPWSMALYAVALFSTIWLLYTLYASSDQLYSWWLNPKPAKTVPARSIPLRSSGLSDEDLMGWLKQEIPLQAPCEDLFGRSFIAERLLQRLKNGENTIALQGGFGSGKSSLVAMTKALAQLQQVPLIFVQVSCWGFESAAKAQEEILNQLLRALGEEVDCLAVQSIPAHYLEAMANQGGWLKSISQVGSGTRSPLAQLQQLSPLLEAIGRRVIIFIDDVDRNGGAFDIGLIQALLAQFRSVEGVSFVLSIGPNQHMDFARLCEFMETVPKLEDQQVLALIKQTREYLLRTYPAPVLVDRLDDLPLEDVRYSKAFGSVGYYFHWSTTLCALLNNPRHLKHALRRVCDAWPRICGEVSIDDLISISTLRTSAPEAFSFYVNNQHLFAGASAKLNELRDDAKTHLLEQLREEWSSVCKNAAFDARAATWLIMHMDHRSYSVLSISGVHSPRKQSVGHPTRGHVYLQRLLTESRGQKDALDTPILQILKHAGSSPSALRDLAEQITDSKAASETFEMFADSFNFASSLLPLLTEVYAVIRQRHGADTDTDLHPGFFAPWRLRRMMDNSHQEEWIIQELECCIPNSLRLLNDIYHHWLGRNKHTAQERQKPRQVMWRRLKKAWLAMLSTEIGRGFNPRFPYTLFHLVFTSDYQTPSEVPLGKVENWKWMGPVLFAAIHEDPEVMLAQVVIALDSIAKRGNENHAYELDEHTLSTWFPGKEREVVGLIAKGVPVHPDMDAGIKYRLEAAVLNAKEWLGKYA